MNRPFTLAACLSMLCLGGCASQAVPSFESADDVVVTERDERGLWYQSEQFDEQLRHSGVLYETADLDAYLTGVMQKLFPEFGNRMRTSVILNHVPNAFVIPNGSVYLDAGLLAFLDNEAQLAAILAHEGSHFVHRHSLEQARSAKQTLAVSAVIGLGTMMGPLVQVLAYSSVMGYSREKEREADNEGFKRLQQAGYDTRQATLVFERLARHAKLMEYKQPVFFSSHPSMSERVKNYQLLNHDLLPGGRVAQREYIDATEDLISGYLNNAVQRGDYKALVFLLESEGRLAQLPAGSAYYLAEGYRRRDGVGDQGRAQALFEQVLSELPDHAPTHGALGRLLRDQGDAHAAKTHLERYLVLAPEATDRAYVEAYIAEIEGRL